jgi:hypothetical protein
MTFIKNNYFKFYLGLQCSLGCPTCCVNQKRIIQNLQGVSLPSNVNGKIREIVDGSGGFEIIRLESGDCQRFFLMTPEVLILIML